MKNLLAIILLLNLVIAQETSAEQFNLKGNYLHIDGKIIFFAPTDGKNKDVAIYFGHFGMSEDIKEVDGFVVLSHFYIPLKPPQAPMSWNLPDSTFLELTDITADLGDDTYYHFVLHKKSSYEVPLVSYIYSVKKGIIMFEILTGGPDIEPFHKSYVLVDDFGLGSLQETVDQ